MGIVFCRALIVALTVATGCHVFETNTTESWWRSPLVTGLGGVMVGLGAGAGLMWYTYAKKAKRATPLPPVPSPSAKVLLHDSAWSKYTSLNALLLTNWNIQLNLQKPDSAQDLVTLCQAMLEKIAPIIDQAATMQADTRDAILRMDSALNMPDLQKTEKPLRAYTTNLTAAFHKYKYEAMVSFPETLNRLFGHYADGVATHTQRFWLGPLEESSGASEIQLPKAITEPATQPLSVAELRNLGSLPLPPEGDIRQRLNQIGLARAQAIQTSTQIDTTAAAIIAAYHKENSPQPQKVS